MAIRERRAVSFEIACDGPGCEVTALAADDPRRTGQYPPGWVPLDLGKARGEEPPSTAAASRKREVLTFHDRAHLQAWVAAAAGIEVLPEGGLAQTVEAAPPEPAADAAPAPQVVGAGPSPAGIGDGPIRVPGVKRACPSRCGTDGMACWRGQEGHPGRHQCNDEHKWGGGSRAAQEDDDDDG